MPLAPEYRSDLDSVGVGLAVLQAGIPKGKSEDNALK
jgi:hypothetical protein